MELQKFTEGRIYLDGIPQRLPTVATEHGDIPSYVQGQTISVGNTCDGGGITWIKAPDKNLFIADRVLLSNVTWHDLNRAGFVDGKLVSIDGKLYRCRLMRGGLGASKQSEWEQLIKSTTEENDVWNWHDMFFWGEDIADHNIEQRVLGGYISATNWTSDFGDIRSDDIGFRPVLEPIVFDNPFSSIPISLEGQDFLLARLHNSFDGTNYLRLWPKDASMFCEIPDGSTLQMYALLASGSPIYQGAPRAVRGELGKQVTITDKFYGEEYLMTWSICDGMAVAACHGFCKGG